MSLILFINGLEQRNGVLVLQLKEVARSFRTGIGFGLFDVSTSLNSQLADRLNIFATPMLAYFRGLHAIPEEAIGHRNISQELSRQSLIQRFGTDRSGARLID